MSQVYSNSARTTLVALIDNSATTMTVTSAAAFPVLVGTDYFYATLYRGDVGAETDVEIVKVTATSSNIFTIVRGQEGTTVQNYITLGGTCRVDLRLTAAGVTGLLQAADNLSALTNLPTARTNLGLAIGVNVQAYDAALTTWAGITLGADVATALGIAVGTAGAPVVQNGALGTPSSGTLSSCSGYPAASTSVAGVAPVATAPAAGMYNYVGITNGETAYANKALFDATVPSTQAFGDAAVVGSASVAARRDHKHAMPATTKDTTAITGMLKGNGTAISAATAGTDYVVPGGVGSFTTLTSTGNATLGDDPATDTHTINGGVVIKNTGAGNCLLIEDSASTDASPVVVDASGNVVVGATAAVGSSNLLQVYSPSAAGVSIWRYSNDSTGPTLSLRKTRDSAFNGFAIAQSGDSVGNINFAASDSATILNAATITAFVDGTPGTNDMPGRLVLSTTADGASSPTTAMTIDSKQQVIIGTASGTTGATLKIAKNITGATNAYGILNQSTIQPDVTANVMAHATSVYTSANGGTPWTLTTLSHHYASQGTFHADSTVANQYGFNAVSSLTGATNNYGFYGAIASGTGRWNFYAAGTAANYFGGVTTFAKAIIEAKTAPTISTNTLTLDLTTSSLFAVSLNANITTLTLSNPPTTGLLSSFILEFTADGTGRTVTWPAAVKWAGGTGPTLTSTNGKKDAFIFYTYDAGTTYIASIIGQAF